MRPPCMKAHVGFMKSECRKCNPDEEKLSSRMGITFPHRRRFINEIKSLLEIKEEYPALFTSENVRHDSEKYFKRIFTIVLTLS